MEEKKINIEITTSEVKSLLLRYLDIKQADGVANVIIGHMSQTDKGLSQLYKSLIGIFPTANYMVGEMLWVKLGSLSTWKYDMTLTEALPNVKDGCILVQVKSIDVYQAYPYTMSVDVIKTGGKTPVVDTFVVSEAQIVEKAEDFTDILDDLEKLRDEADLPF